MTVADAVEQDNRRWPDTCLLRRIQSARGIVIAAREEKEKKAE